MSRNIGKRVEFKCYQLKQSGYTIDDLLVIEDSNSYAIQYSKDGKTHVLDTSDTNPSEKWCHKCGSVKGSADFYKESAATDSLQSMCKTCQNTYNDARIKKKKNSRKECTKCGKLKDKSCFSKNNSNKSGLQNHCKSCAKLYNDSRANTKPTNQTTITSILRDKTSTAEDVEKVTEIVQGEKIMWKGERYVHNDYHTEIVKSVEVALDDAYDRILLLEKKIIDDMLGAK